MNIKRTKEILKKFETNQALYNWCDEYNEFIRNSIGACVSLEWDYMLKASLTDSNSPVSYEELDLFDIDNAKEHLIYNLEEINETETLTKNDILRMSKEELKDLFEKLNYDYSEAEIEVFEWWIIKDPLKYRLEQQGEIFLNDAWGRTTTGQTISLDDACINAFIHILKDKIKQ